MRNIYLIISFLVGFLSYGQFSIPEKPSKETSVYDYGEVMNAMEREMLERKLINYADSTSTQMVVVTIKSLQGEYIGTLTPAWAQKWGIGDKDKDNGVLVLLAAKERKIWISVGYGLEDKLTAGRNGEIIRNYIIPRFKEGDYYGGLDAGTTEIMKVFSGTYKADEQGDEMDWVAVIIVAVVVLMVLILMIKAGKNGGGKGGGGLSRGGWDGPITIGSGGFGSWGGGGSSSGWGSGGFGGGFGGGGFSGGGAGGSW